MVNNPEKEACVDRYFTIVLPFHGRGSERFLSYFQRFFKRSNSTVRVMFRPFKIQSYFSLKFKVPEMSRSGVIYKYTCWLAQIFPTSGRRDDT